MPESVKVVATNRKAFHDYFIQETYEEGVALTGTEIKSVRAGSVNLRDSFAQMRDGEMWLQNVHISPYEAGNRYNVNPYRTRKLLLRIQKEKNITMLYTTHNMEEVEELCDRVIFINKGKLRDDGTPKELIAKFGKKDMNEVFLDIAREGTHGS